MVKADYPKILHSLEHLYQEFLNLARFVVATCQYKHFLTKQWCLSWLRHHFWAIFVRNVIDPSPALPTIFNSTIYLVLFEFTLLFCLVFRSGQQSMKTGGIRKKGQPTFYSIKIKLHCTTSCHLVQYMIAILTSLTLSIFQPCKLKLLSLRTKIIFVILCFYLLLLPIFSIPILLLCLQFFIDVNYYQQLIIKNKEIRNRTSQMKVKQYQC